MNFLNSLFLYAYMFVIFDRSPFEVEDSVKLFCLPDPFVDPISVVLRRLGNEELCCGSLVKTVGRLKLAVHMIQYKSHVTKKIFYAVEFTECHEEQPLFGYVLLFIIFGCERFAVIQWLKMEEWPLLHNDDDCMTDVVDAYSNLQELIGKHLLPAQETHDLVEILVGDITAHVVCMKTLGSSCIFVSRYPNIIECD